MAGLSCTINPRFYFALTIGGRSALWLMIMYLVGAYIKRYVQINEKLLPKLIIGFFVSILITWASKYIIELVTLKIIGEPKFGNYLVNYTSPLIVATAVFLLLLFSKMQLGTRAQSILRFFAPLTFGVYLLQEEPLIRSAFITGKLTWVASVNGVAIPFITVGISMLVWLAGSLIDYMRTLVFRFLRVNTLCASIHPTAYVSPTATINPGTVILPHAVVNTDVAVGKGCIINLGAIVDHGSILV